MKELTFHISQEKFVQDMLSGLGYNHDQNLMRVSISYITLDIYLNDDNGNCVKQIMVFENVQENLTYKYGYCYYQ